MIAYPAMLDVPTELVEFLAALLAAERVNRGTRTGSRAPGRCAKSFCLVRGCF